jgi:hypothetical protein
LIVIDFKENLKLNVSRVETCHQFYEKPSRTCFGINLFLKEGNEIKKYPIDILSKCLSHQTWFVTNVMETILKSLVELNLKINKLYLWMDNAKHFRSKEMLGGLVNISDELKFKIYWNYFGEYHGKSCCDSRFSLISRSIKEYIGNNENLVILKTNDIIEAIKSYELTKDSIQIKLNDLESPDIIHKLEIDDLMVYSIFKYNPFNNILHASIQNNEEWIKLEKKLIIEEFVNKEKKEGFIHIENSIIEERQWESLKKNKIK